MGQYVYRIAAKVNDEIIVKEGQLENRVKSAMHNAVVHRLCNTSSIPYPMAWWKRNDAFILAEYIGLFTGKVLHVNRNSAFNFADHEVPNFEVKPSIVRGLLGRLIPSEMDAHDIDSFGYWHFGERDCEKISLLGSMLPIPSEVRLEDHDEKQEVLFLLDAQDVFDSCPECNSEIIFGGVVFGTEHARLFPAICCNSMIWSPNEKELNPKWA